MEIKEDKRMVKLQFFFEIATFWTYIKKKKTHSVLVHSRSSHFTFGLQLMRGPKALKFDF